MWIICFFCVIVLGAVSGFYPAILLSGIKTITALKGENVKGSRSILPRRILMTFQFIISIVLIIGVFVILKQLNYMKHADLGFEKEHVIIIQSSSWQNRTNRQVIKENLLKNPDIKGVAFSDEPLGGFEVFFPGDFEVNGIKMIQKYRLISPDFFDIYLLIYLIV